MRAERLVDELVQVKEGAMEGTIKAVNGHRDLKKAVG